jgi:transposase
MSLSRRLNMGQKQKHVVYLTAEEQQFLVQNTSSGNWSARRIKRAQILLKANKNRDNPLEDLEIAQDLHCCRSMVATIRERFGKERLGVLTDKPRSGRPKKFDGDVQAHVIAIACSSPPEGRQRWTLRLIADKVVTLSEIESCSHSSVGSLLKKANLSLG